MTATSGHRLRKALVLCVDAAYLPFALFLAAQIDAQEPGRDYDICLISDAPLEIPAAFAHLRIRLYEPVADDAYGMLDEGHLARSTYLRLWAPRLLAADYDRIIYLDSDIWADGAGLSRLFETDLRGKVLAAVLDVQQWYRPKRNVKEFRVLNRPLTRYFNGGMLLIDTARFEEEAILDRCIALARTAPQAVIHHDQSLLNLVINGDWVELSPVWNWQWPMKYPLFGDWVGPRLLHFIGAIKPWDDPEGLYSRRFHMAYEAFFATYFPGSDRVRPPGPSPLQSRRRIAWMFLRFSTLRRAVLRYMAQFPDDYATR